MAALLFRSELSRRGASVDVASAGFVTEGEPAPPQAVQVMQRIGVDMSAHRSRIVNPADLDAADLVLAMTRQHLVDLVVMAPAVWARAFTLSDAVRRGLSQGPRRDGESIRDWAERLGAGRSRRDVLALAGEDDIADPMGGSRREFEAARDRLAALVGALADLIWPWRGRSRA